MQRPPALCPPFALRRLTIRCTDAGGAGRPQARPALSTKRAVSDKMQRRRGDSGRWRERRWSSPAFPARRGDEQPTRAPRPRRLSPKPSSPGASPARVCLTVSSARGTAQQAGSAGRPIHESSQGQRCLAVSSAPPLQPPAGEPDRCVYVVRSGDTLSKISRASAGAGAGGAGRWVAIRLCSVPRALPTSLLPSRSIAQSIRRTSAGVSSHPGSGD